MIPSFGGKLGKKECSERGKLLFLGGIFLFSAILLFTHLGAYSLWDDEAETALGARGILIAGDTTAVLGHNIQARRAGINLVNLHDRLTPPLASYLTALFFRFGGENAWLARFPFALCGLLAITQMLYYLWKEKVPSRFIFIFGLALIFQVSFFLYFRQCRYYGSSLFLAIFIFYLYLAHWRSASARVGIGLLASFLFLSHPLICVQVGALLLFDWLVFRRREDSWQLRWLPEIGLPFLLLVLPSLFVWNPFLTKSSNYLQDVSWLDRITLFWWNIRDSLAAEFMPASMLVLAPLAYLISKDKLILRGAMALLVVIIVTSLLSYQRVQVTNVADVRYLLPAIPIGLALSTITLGRLFGQFRCGWIVCLLILGTNIGSGKIFLEGRPGSLSLTWWNELINPIEEPYSPVAQWINRNIPAESSVLVFPDYMMYPLMFHAPQAVYAWQLGNGFDQQFSNLEDIHFRGRKAPDYLIVFGPGANELREELQALFQERKSYHEIARVNVFWKDLYRPEVFWRTFSTIPISDSSQGITIFQVKSL